jgi:hypothetical protein
MATNGFPSRDEVGPHMPLRLGVAAALVFPDGSMTASGLRRDPARREQEVRAVSQQ